MLIVGLASSETQMQSNAIRALIFNMKSTIQFDSMLRGKKQYPTGGANDSKMTAADGAEDPKEITNKLASTDASL
jgi:hypothetical protein